MSSAEYIAANPLRAHLNPQCTDRKIREFRRIYSRQSPESARLLKSHMAHGCICALRAPVAVLCIQPPQPPMSACRDSWWATFQGCCAHGLKAPVAISTAAHTRLCTLPQTRRAAQSPRGSPHLQVHIQSSGCQAQGSAPGPAPASESRGAGPGTATGIIMAIAEKRLRVSERMDMGLALGRRRHQR